MKKRRGGRSSLIKRTAKPRSRLPQVFISEGADALLDEETSREMAVECWQKGNGEWNVKVPGNSTTFIVNVASNRILIHLKGEWKKVDID